MNDQVVIEESERTVVEIDDGVETRSVVVDSETISVVTALEQGPPGAGDKHYEQQFTNSASVTVNHNLGKKPSVEIIDSAGDKVIGDVNYVSDNQLLISLSAPTGGVIICN